MSEWKPSKEDLEALERMREFEKRIDEVPEHERVPITNPRLTDNIAIGMDEKGELYPLHDAFGRVITQEQALRRARARDELDPDEVARLRKTMSEEEVRQLVEQIDYLWQKERRSDEDDELAAKFEAYYLAMTVPRRD
jgi:hypothetical protein